MLARFYLVASFCVFVVGLAAAQSPLDRRSATGRTSSGEASATRRRASPGRPPRAGRSEPAKTPAPASRRWRDRRSRPPAVVRPADLAARPWPGLAGIRHQRLHAARHLDRTAGTGDRRLDSPRDRLRGVARRDAQHPQLRPAKAPRLPYARNAGRRRRRRRSVRRKPGRKPRVRPAGRDGRSAELAGEGPGAAPGGGSPDAGRPGVGASERGRGHPAGRLAAAKRLSRAQFAPPVGEQRPVDGRVLDARPRTTSAT